MGELDPRAWERIKGPSWGKLRDSFNKICKDLLSVASKAKGDLVTIYIKFTLDEKPTSPVYAVLWINTSKKLTIGLALPEEYKDKRLGGAPPRKKYAGLTKFLEISSMDEIPSEFQSWAYRAYEYAKRGN